MGKIEYLIDETIRNVKQYYFKIEHKGEIDASICQDRQKIEKNNSERI